MVSSSWRQVARASRELFKSRLLRCATRRRVQYWCLINACLTAGDHGILLKEQQCWSAKTSILVIIVSILSSSWMLAGKRCCFSMSWVIWSDRWCFLHWEMTSLQNFWTCWSWLLFTPLNKPGVWVAGLLPKRTVGSKSAPIKRWSPLMRRGRPNERIQAYRRASTKRQVPAKTSIVEEPLWWVAGFLVAGYWYACKSVRPVSVNNHVILDWGLSMSSFAFIPSNTSFPAWVHDLIWVMRSLINWVLGLGLRIPCCCRRRVCCAVTMFAIESNCWGCTW